MKVEDMVAMGELVVRAWRRDWIGGIREAREVMVGVETR